MSTSISFFSSTIFTTSPHLHNHPSKLLFKSNKAHFSVTRSAPLPVPVLRSELATLPILSFEGTQVGSTTLDLKSAPLETARSVVHRGIITDLRNRRRGTASTLTRAEVRGGGIKPYAQKKTGHARRGSQRTPLRPGGGVIFGPKPKDWSVKMNKKEKQLAISTAICSAVENTIVVEDLEDKLEKPKTKEFIQVMRRWGLDPKEKAMILAIDIPENVQLSGRNIATLKMLTPRTLNLFDILDSEKLVLTKGAVEFLNWRYGVESNQSIEEEDDDEEESEQGAEGDEDAEAAGGRSSKQTS